MYLISAYFDDYTNKILSRYIEKIADFTGNKFMTDNHVTPHITISSLEARNGELLIPFVKQLEGKLTEGPVQFISIGTFFPYVMFAAPVLNEYLLNLQEQVYQSVCNIREVTVSKFYRPKQWMPHITLGKKLTKEQMQIAFTLMQESFMPFQGKITSIGLAKTNPHEDILTIELES